MESDESALRLYTPRLCLRPFTAVDGPRVQELAGDKRVAIMTASIPHPYPDGLAEEFIASQQAAAAQGREYTFAITLAGTRTPGREGDLGDTGHVVGAIGVRVDGEREQRRGELGYWIGVHYWNKGFATEAGRTLLEFGFSRLKLQRLTGLHYTGNPASGRVMQKLGLKAEGILRGFHERFGERRDVAVYGLLADEWAVARRARRMVPTGKILQVA